MLLLEIFNFRRGESDTAGQADAAAQRWHDKLSAGGDKVKPEQLQKAGLSQTGVWWLSPQGKRLAGPFPTMQAASEFRANRPDRIPNDSVARRVD